MTAALKPVDVLMQQAVADRIFPGGVLHVSKNLSVRMFQAYGRADIYAGRKMTRETIFDLASLTKPLATTPALMSLIQAGKLKLDDTLGRILPPFGKTDKALITIRQLLTHDSGLPDYRPYFETLRNISPEKRQEKLRRFLLQEPLLHPPGKQTLYSDLGFMILQWVVESTTRQRLDRFVTGMIFMPLGLKNMHFIDLAADRRKTRYAATENCPWRGVLLKGAVHDDNAFVMGGIAGHAGLFGTAGEVYGLLATLLSIYQGRQKTPIFRPAMVRTFLNRPPGAERALGFDAPAETGASCGRRFSKKSVGHLGFTGTSFWMDLERSVIVVLLTNRVHPSSDNIRIREFRPVLHDAVMKCIG
ncbi:MAG: serine hydrolase [Desulfobacterales bacterium]|nr:serine hydrolase [Desulfobacterales bacterium]